MKSKVARNIIFGRYAEENDESNIMYDCCTYFQSINKIVQALFTVTFETFHRTFLVPQNRVYTPKQFYFKNI